MSLELVTVPGWLQIPWLVHGFTTRMGGKSKPYGVQPHDGELNLGFTAADDPEAVRSNRSLLIQAFRMPVTRLSTLRQIHSASIHVAATVADGSSPREGDGLVSDGAGELLGILTADCVPVLVVDPVHRAVGAFHAGWRGTMQGIVAQGITRMSEEFGSEPEQLLAAIGPSIGPCCYLVGGELRNTFRGNFAYADALFQENEAGITLDLWEANRRQLLDAGLPEHAVHGTRTCTSCCVSRFFSHRAERGHTGRMLAVVGIRTS